MQSYKLIYFTRISNSQSFYKSSTCLNLYILLTLILLKYMYKIYVYIEVKLPKIYTKYTYY